jgi:hypothetical protein
LHDQPVCVDCVSLACLCWGSTLCLQEALPCLGLQEALPCSGTGFSLDNGSFFQQETLFYHTTHSAQCLTLSTILWGVELHNGDSTPPSTLDESWHRYTFALSPGLSNYICLRYLLTVHFLANMFSDIYVHIYTFAVSSGLSDYIYLRHLLTVHFLANMSSDIYARLNNTNLGERAIASVACTSPS